MKIIHLVIDNIASVSHAVIDFDASPLADADVFLISGNVGAGKSTLLDCICLALYGGTPRLSPAAKGEDADTARIMREGTASSAVTLDFIANDGTPCRARWSRRRARGRINGTLQKAEWTLTVALASEKEITYTKRVEVAEAIRQAVGLGYHDFCRTTMLAQGRFASFLKGSDDEKAGILEKLTGTRRYALIGKRIYQEYQLAADAYAREEAVIASVARLSPEETDALAATLKAETAKAVDAAARADAIRASIAWINTAASLRTAKTAADQALDRAEAAFASPQAADRRSFIALWETSALARAAAEAAEESARAVDAFLAARNMDRAIFESLSRTSPDRIDALRIADKALADAVTAARTSIADLGRSIRAHEAARSDAVTPDLTPARLEDSLKAALAEADAARQAVGSIQAKLDADAAAAARVKEIESAVEPLRRRRLLLARLNELFGSSDGKKFRTIAQSYVLADLINSANVYMRSLMPRYRLIGSPNSYNIDVEDSYEGYARRSAKHISGGETFVVSLALALALADIGTGLGVDTLFIDEGFGNLSGKALEDAVETLRSLRRRGGRRVGIISHIESLRDRIPVRIDVEQIPGRNSSKYTVTQA